MRSRIILAACLSVLLAGCSLSTKAPPMQRTLVTATETTIPAGTQFRTPDGSVGVTTQPVAVTLPSGTTVDGGWGPALSWLLAVFAVACTAWVARAIVKRRAATPQPIPPVAKSSSLEATP